jgi:YfiH family protein
MIRTHNNGLAYYQFESLAGREGLAHAVFTRHGGVSLPPFHSLNLGGSVGDDPAAVDANRATIFKTLGLSPDQVVTGYQVHSMNVACVGSEHGGRVLPETDGLLTQEPVALFSRFADCVPILLFDPVRRAAGILHAGWRGTAAQIAAHGVRRMAELFGCRPQDILACIGPSIGPCCYQVRDDFVQAICRAWPGAEPFIRTENGARSADLWAMNHRQLQDAGVREIEISRICTACRRDEFFSHRGDGGRTGRFGVILHMTD